LPATFLPAVFLTTATCFDEPESGAAAAAFTSAAARSRALSSFFRWYPLATPAATSSLSFQLATSAPSAPSARSV